MQFQVAFSATVKGVGVFAGQPYHCAVTMFKDDVLVPPCFGTHYGYGGPNQRIPNVTNFSSIGCTKNVPAPDVPYCDNCPATDSGLTLLCECRVATTMFYSLVVF